MQAPAPKCLDKRPCFARTREKRCKALIQSYDYTGRLCPFCKQKRTDKQDGRKDSDR